jgi:hypothetical protein
MSLGYTSGLVDDAILAVVTAYTDRGMKRHEKGTLLILTGWVRHDNVASCREQPDPPRQG